MTKEQFQRMYDEWWYTIEGVDEPQEWIDGLSEIFTTSGIGMPTNWWEFHGKDMNEEYKLTGDNAYPDDLNILACSLEGLDVDKLAAFKMQHGGRWFTDIVDNNAHREKEKKKGGKIK